MRSSQPFNSVATSSVRAVLAGLGIRSEWVIKHLHRVGVVRVKLPNDRIMSLWSRGDDWVSNQLYWRGWAGYESETAALFFTLAKQARVTLDVGAYVGFYTILAAHANPAGQVYSFEPLPTVHERLRRNVQLNNLGNVECLASAVGDVEGTAEFYHYPYTLPTSSSLSREFMSGVSNLTSSKVAVLRLDRFVQERGLERIDLVKIDTESTEPNVLAGFAETLRRDRPSIVCEVLKGRGSEAALETFFRSAGYRSYLLTPDGPVSRDRVEGHPEWLNYLFTPLSPDAVADLWRASRQPCLPK